MDKTRFHKNYSKAYYIIIFNSDKLILIINLDNQKYITSVESINNREKMILLIIILYSILILEKRVEEKDFDKDILLATSPTRYFNDKLALQ